ncbi:MAG: acyltransferase, partial [Actinomycetaceae bacterium]|nr:acyltransferase [Actinomycetaceae bacterium]
MGNQSHSTRIRGLDGLRTLAVFLVLGYHLLVGVFNSGFIGVDVFFVISGFLITSLLLREEETSGRISLHAFWLRRLRRLVPAVVVATFVTVALAGLVGGDSAVQLRWQSLGAVTGTYNWLEIAFHSSYFEAQSPLLLTNMWSLAVEQQFYVVWPLLLLSVIRFIPRRLRPLVAIVLATASFAGTAFLMQQGEDVTRAYVGTDTHSFGLMIGAALALSLPGLMNGKRDDVSPRRVRVYGVAGWIGGIAVVALAVFVPDKASFYPWVMLGASIATAFLIRAMLPDMGQGVLTRALWAVFHSPVMCWIGERSYGIYLWHWPLWVIAYYWAHLPVLVVAVIVTALSFVFAHLSYVFIETPIRREGFRVVTSRVVSFFRNPERIIVATMPVFLSIVVLVVALVTSPNMNSAQQFVYDGQKGT